MKFHWHDIPIKRKLMSFFILIILCISLLNTYTFGSAFRYLKLFEQELVRNSEIQQIQSLLTENNKVLNQYIRLQENNTLKGYNATIPELWFLWNSISRNSRTSRSAGFEIDAIRLGLMAYIEDCSLIMNSRIIRQGDFADEINRANRIYGYIQKYMENLLRIRLNDGIRIHEENVEAMYLVQRISFLATALLAMAFLLFASLFSNHIAGPLSILSLHARRMAEGELEIPDLDYKGSDELGVMTESFNRMKQNIQSLVLSLKEKQEIEKKFLEDELKLVEMNRSLREARFTSLQAQINPHFLFNTLNTISRMSLFEGAPRSVRLIESLSNVFRHTLESKKTITTLGAEIGNMKEYMHIQKTRFEDRLNYKVIADKELLDTPLPLLTVQPLVENALIHGIEPKEEGGTITLQCRSEDDRIYLSVSDSGVGMSETRKHELLSPDYLNIEGREKRIGLANVMRRLNLTYQGDVVFNIESCLNAGTSIIISLPRGKTCTESF